MGLSDGDGVSLHTCRRTEGRGLCAGNRAPCLQGRRAGAEVGGVPGPRTQSLQSQRHVSFRPCGAVLVMESFALGPGTEVGEKTEGWRPGGEAWRTLGQATTQPRAISRCSDMVVTPSGHRPEAPRAAFSEGPELLTHYTTKDGHDPWSLPTLPTSTVLD